MLLIVENNDSVVILSTVVIGGERACVWLWFGGTLYIPGSSRPEDGVCTIHFSENE